MELIDKTALIADIQRRIDLLKSNQNPEGPIFCFARETIIEEYKNILSFLDTLEVKEVYLEEEIDEYMKLHHLHIKDGGRIVFENDDTPNFMCDFRDIANHFFSLGLKAKGAE